MGLAYRVNLDNNSENQRICAMMSVIQAGRADFAFWGALDKIWVKRLLYDDQNHPV
jgi:hypothetical protein